jgi:hypothetical protein
VEDLPGGAGFVSGMMHKVDVAEEYKRLTI